jgi:hypothetical protein
MKRSTRINLALLAIAAWCLLLAAALAIGCAGHVHAIPETETRYAAYGVTWPADASRDPSSYHTVEIDGRMVTTTRRGT